MKRSLLRRTAVLLTAFLLFAQGTVALAACAMDRGAMASAMEIPADVQCDCGEMQVNSGPSANCVAHCTADLQLAGGAAVFVGAPIVPALYAVAFPDSSIRIAVGKAPPPRSVPS